jgi:hypothetical protein
MRSFGRLAIVVLFLAGSSLAQSQFSGKWETLKPSQATGRHSITLKIAEEKQAFGGTIVFVNPDGSEISSPIRNPKRSPEKLEFESGAGREVFYWILTIESPHRALLHGSVGEMLIDEQMVKGKQ